MNKDAWNHTEGDEAPPLILMTARLSSKGEYSLEEKVYDRVTWGFEPCLSIEFGKGKKAKKGIISFKYKVGCNVKAEGTKETGFMVVPGEKIEASGWDWADNRDELEARLHRALQVAVAESIQMAKKQLEGLSTHRNNHSIIRSENMAP